jgi:zinc protease
LRSVSNFRVGASVINHVIHSRARRLVPVVAALLVTGVAPLALAQSAAPRDAQESQTAATPPATSAAPVLPQKVDPILESYARAIGGRQAWEKFTSQVLMGTIEVPSMSLTGTIVIHEKAPNKFMSAVIVNGAVFRQGFDGTQGWTDDPKNGLRDQAGAELAESKRGADFLHAFRMGRAYAKIEVTGAEKIGDRDTWIVEATAPEGGEPTKMYFDTQTGLMLRVISQNHDADGVSQLQEDFEDYRVVDSVRIPFVWRQTNGDTTYTLKFSEVHHNVELPDSEFAKPAAQ